MKTYTIQTFCEVYCNIQPHELPEEDFLSSKRAYTACLMLLWFEEKFEILSQNYYEWEEEIKNSYDFFLKNQNSDSDCNSIMEKFGLEEIIILNRRMNNLLSSIRLYQDQVSKNLSSLEQSLHTTLLSSFRKKTNELYDSSLSYQIMEFLRNYMQLRG